MSAHLFSITQETPVIVQGATGRMGRRHAALMRDYGTRIVGGTSTHAGDVDGLPIFTNCAAAVAATGAVASVAMVPPADVERAAREAIEAGIRVVVSIAEGVPVHDALRLRSVAVANDACWLGASTPGFAIPGKVKLGFLPDVALFSGQWAIITKSGTLSYEVGYRLGASGLGQSIWIGVGGDSVKGLRFADLVPHLAQHAETSGVILVGEVGGTEEEEFAAALMEHRFPKPVLALLAGQESKEGVSMGHAGALTYGGMGTLASKTRRLAAAGVIVCKTIDNLISQALEFSPDFHSAAHPRGDK